MMLRIKRVPTVVSNYQKDEADDTARRSAGCGKNCLKSCCIPGAKLPLYAFKKVSMEREEDVLKMENTEPPVAFLDSLVLGEWEDRMQRGLFRYDVTACETKVLYFYSFHFIALFVYLQIVMSILELVFLALIITVIPGEYGFIAQLNEGRHLKKRPTEFRVDKVLQPFDGNKFNFTKVGQEEVLFQFEASEDGEVQFYPNAPIDVENSPSVVAINVSPIEYGHVLLIPRIFECLPQRIDRESFLLALHMAAEAGNPHFRLGYNSLGAFATINHLHFQAYYLAVPLPIEKAPTKELTTLSDGVIVSELLKYPVKGLVFEGGNTLQDLSDTVSDACICLQDNNIPYNVLISDSGKRIFLLPQCYAEKQALGEVSLELLDTQVNPAVWEISGHMVLKRRKDYDEASEGNAWRLLAEVSLSDERFREVNALIFEAIAGSEDGIENGTKTLLEEPCLEEDDAITKSSHRGAMVAGTHECLVLQ
ncbi:GDP-L-galactose phosphorylase 1-like protein [Gossypium australe]|uniref:GDP-L-galactose phosphorylase 1-like protein n=1 Tax=Gossypium australe TaxID=47621 RepID=A0A5B6U9U1_9ROSI|nr:GDP-L-galactose phosphorylase 1-like protein [Gossypium australe]